MLCMPIKDASGAIVGVSLLVNKHDGTPFTKNDEDMFEVGKCGLKSFQSHDAICYTMSNVLLVFSSTSMMEHLSIRIMKTCLRLTNVVTKVCKPMMPFGMEY